MGRDTRRSAPSTATSARSRSTSRTTRTVAALHRLVARADVLLENYRPGVAARLGADYETLRELNPRLVYASISGFGQTGPYAQRPGYDLIAQGAGGRDERHRRARRQPGQVRRSRSAISRPGCSAPSASSRALHARERTGEGQQDRHLAVGGRARALDLGDGRAVGDRPRAAAARLRPPPDRALPGAAHRATATSPSAATTRSCGERLCAVIGRAGAGRRPALRHQRRRGWRTAPSWSPSSRPRSTARGTDALGRRAAGGGRPAGPILDYAQVVDDPHTQAREMVVEMEHPEAGTVHALGIPVKLSAPRPARSAGPRRCWASTPTRSCAASSTRDELTSRSSAAASAAWVTFDRPEAHNAMTFAMYEPLVEALRDRRRRRRRPRDGAARRGREGVRRRHRHPPVRRVRRVGRRTGSSTRRAIDAVARPARGGAQADGRARRRLRDGLRAGDLGRLRPARLTPAAKFGMPIARTVGNCLSMEQLRPPGQAARRAAAEGRHVHRAPDRGRGGAGDRLATEVVEPTTPRRA